MFAANFRRTIAAGSQPLTNEFSPSPPHIVSFASRNFHNLYSKFLFLSAGGSFRLFTAKSHASWCVFIRRKTSLLKQKRGRPFAAAVHRAIAARPQPLTNGIIARLAAIVHTQSNTHLMTSACFISKGGSSVASGATLRRLIRTGIYIFVCMLVEMPAAHAQGDDDTPSPDQIAWGVLCFVVTLAFVLRLCLNPLKARKRRFQSPRAKRRAPRRPDRENRPKQSA